MNVPQCDNKNKNKNKGNIIWYNSKDQIILTPVNDDEKFWKLCQEMNDTTEDKDNKEEVVKDFKHINTKDKESKYKEKFKTKVKVKEVTMTKEIKYGIKENTNKKVQFESNIIHDRQAIKN